MKIHPNREAAEKACEEYAKSLSELSERFGVHEFCEDSSASIFITAKYHDQEGKVQTYYY